MARPCLDGSVKFKLLIRKLGLPDYSVLGLLEYLWMAANECGNPVFASDEHVEAATRWDGEPGRVFEALRDGGWIDELPGGQWAIHDYWDHCPDYAFRRAKCEAERKRKGKTLSDVRRDAANARWKRRKQPAPGNANGMQTDANGGHLHPFAMQTDASGATPAPAPIVEENILFSSCPTPSETASGPASGEQVALTFPTTGKGAKEWFLTVTKVREYEEAFPHLDVRAECRRALQWIRDNPAKRKTAKGMPAFLTRWLGKSQNQGRGGSSPPPQREETLEQIAARVKAERETLARKYGNSHQPGHGAERNGEVP